MSDTSAYVGDALLNWIKGTVMPAAPASVKASLWNGDPNSGGVEVTGTVALTRQTVAWAAVAARAVSSNADLNFGTANGPATVTFVAVYDVGGTNQIATKGISSTSISNGLAVKILSGNLTLSY